MNYYKIKAIKNDVCAQISLEKSTNDTEIEELITGAVFEYSKHTYLSIKEKQEIIEYIFNAMCRLDVLQPLVDDETITEIMINGPDNIFIERDGRIEKCDILFESSEKLEDVIQSIVAKVNRTVNESSPIVDARLQDGSRVCAVLKPIALNGPILTIRKFSKKPLTIDKLINNRSLTKEAAEYLEKLVLAKYNILICGGTGSGKTTFLNVLSNFISKDERIITIEDSAELQINIPNIVRLETKGANAQGVGRITIHDLIKTSLRMRPDRIIVGEVRGGEALEMLQAMNTGHDGSLSTGHANSTKDMLSRLETMVISAAPFPLDAVRKQIASALDIIIHLGRLRDKSRRVLEITEVLDYKNGEIQLNPLFVFQEDKESITDERVNGSLQHTNNKLSNNGKLEMAGIV